MKILAIHPDNTDITVHSHMPPLGMLWIAAQLRKAGNDICFIDQQVDARDPAVLAEKLKPELVLIGGTTHSRFDAFYAANEVRCAWPDACIIYGGPHATFTARETLMAVHSIDLVVRGEGEETCLEIVKWIRAGKDDHELKRIRGISYRDNGGVIDNDPREEIMNLDSLEPPARDMVPMKRYNMKMDYLPDLPGTSLITARGCPVGCTFCSASAMFGPTYRMRSHTKVVDEIEKVMNTYGFKGIKIFDSTFTLNRRHVEGILYELKRRKLQFPWECEIRANTVTKELLAKMQEAGCYYVDMGIESGSQRVIDECIKKNITIEQAERVLKWTNELGLKTKAFFCIGHPGETLAEARETLRMIHRNRKSIQMLAYRTGIHIYPGTYVCDYAEENNLLPEGFSWSKPYANLDQDFLLKEQGNIPLLIQPQLGVKELSRLRMEYIRMQMFSPHFMTGKIKWIMEHRLFSRYTRMLTAYIKSVSTKHNFHMPHLHRHA